MHQPAALARRARYDPWMIREAHVTVGNQSVRYLEAGAGWPVVLLHAFPLNADMWRPQLEQVPQGWRMIAPDFRGFGPAAGAGSGRKPDGVAAKTIDDFASDVDGLLDALEIPAAVIGGLSMGGYVAFALSRLAPERFTAMVLADTKASADTPAGREARQKMIELVSTRGPSAVAEQMLPKLLGATSHATRPEVVAAVKATIESASVEGIVGAIEAMLGRPDSTPDLAGISWPVLLLVGSEDEITPAADAVLMEQGIPRSRLVTLPAAGHLSNLETPQLFARALEDFLQSSL
jgi:pimeloyl-ACP methyl ester carboxylesterase